MTESHAEGRESLKIRSSLFYKGSVTNHLGVFSCFSKTVFFSFVNVSLSVGKERNVS